jgi:hypothetical protein
MTAQSSSYSSQSALFLERVGLPYLRGAQNEDGGWGFQHGSQSRVEPTAWALLALLESASDDAADDATARGLKCLLKAQLTEGSWPAVAGQDKGCWVTSLACLALLSEAQFRESLGRGIRWLSDERPGEAGRWFRLLRRLRGVRHTVAQNDFYYGWSWTSGTASWVEPTALALIAMRDSPPELLPAQVQRRIQLAEAMLYDRMSPGGGWNCGNPLVYGVPGEPQVCQTSWALLALRDHSDRPEVQKSLAWLETNWGRIESPSTLALACIALDVLGRKHADVRNSLCNFYEKSEIMWNVPAVSSTILAMSEKQEWLVRSDQRKKS